MAAESLPQLGAGAAPAALEVRLKELATNLGIKPAEFIHPARVAVSGRSVGPSSVRSE